MAQDLVVLGTGDLALEVADLVEDGGEFVITHFAENLDRSRCGGEILGRPVIWVDDLRALAATHRAVCAIGTPKRSRFTEEAAALGMGFASVVHPSARVLRSASVGAGSILSLGACVASRAVLGSHVILNRGAMVGHQTIVGDHGTLGPGCNVASRSDLGPRVHVGMGAIVLGDLRIGADAVIGAGAVVHRDVPEGATVVGNPAEIARTAAP